MKKTILTGLATAALLLTTGVAQAGTLENLERERAILVETLLAPTLSPDQRQQTIAIATQRLVDLERMVSQTVPTFSFRGDSGYFPSTDFDRLAGGNAGADETAADRAQRLGNQSRFGDEVSTPTRRMALSLLASMVQQPLFYVLIFVILVLFLLAKLRRT